MGWDVPLILTVLNKAYKRYYNPCSGPFVKIRGDIPRCRVWGLRGLGFGIQGWELLGFGGFRWQHSSIHGTAASSRNAILCDRGWQRGREFQ